MKTFKAIQKEKQLENSDIDLSEFSTIIRTTESIPTKVKNPKLKMFRDRDIVELDSIDFSKFNVILREETLPELDYSNVTILREGPKGKDGNGLQGPKGDKGETGEPGPIGFTGAPGPRGETGTQGVDGLPGKTGPRGVKGNRGEQGIQGIPGPPGEHGKDGLIGATGKRGPKGEQGIQGIPGADGKDGKDGEQGFQGPKGERGDKGFTGIKGDKGPKGDPGPAGEKGETGPQGVPGETGPAGERGPIGKTGIQGVVGPIGVQGIQGERGAQGHQGVAGPVGPKGEAGIQGPQGIQGPKGDVGPQGPVPKYDIQKNAIRFEDPDKKWGPWLDLSKLVPMAMGGGGSNLDFFVGSEFHRDVKYLNIDTESLIVSRSGDVLTIGINPSILTMAAAGVIYTFDFLKLNKDQYTILLTHLPVQNSETVILNGLILTKDLDYTVSGAQIDIDSRHKIKSGWNLTVKYSYV